MIKTQPLDYQVTGVDAAIGMKRHILCCDTGSGKSLMALMLMERLRNEFGVNEFIIACPKTAVSTWRREIPKHTDFSAVYGYYSPHAVVSVVQINQFDREIDSDKMRKPACLIIDEAHMLSSEDSLQATKFRGGIGYVGERKVSFTGFMNKFEFVYGLTATPMLNHIENLFYIVDSFFPGYFGTIHQFMSLYTQRTERTIYRNGKSQRIMEIVAFCNLDNLSLRLRPIMFRHAMNYDLRFFFKYGNLSSPELEQYRVAGRGLLHEAERDFVGRLPDLQQVVNGSVDQDGNYRHGPELSSKEQLLLESLNFLAESKVGCVVFTTCLNTMARIRAYIGPKTKFEKVWYMQGETDSATRHHIATNFGPCDCLFATMVGGVSLNLQAVNNVIFFDSPWSVGSVLQCCGRVARVDSTFPHMNVVFLGMSGTIDEYKINVMSANLHLIRAILSGFSFVEVAFEKVRRTQIVQLRRSLLWGK